MSIKTRKSRNPATVDNWLDSIGLYRKNVAYDETCLFRAVSEQLFDCQIYHERVRKECIEYGRQNYYEFCDLLENAQQWYDHLELLEKHMVVCGNIEIRIISYKYNYDVIVYDAVHQKVTNVTQRNLNKSLKICFMNEDHYDVVHPKEHIQNTGFCQSIVYNILYEDVFKIANVQDIVRGMLYEKEFVSLSFAEINNNEQNEKSDALVSALNIAPFPFKIAKALDPTIYRNIEYDSWTEIRKEMRLGEWYYGDDNLILGTRCILNQDDQTYECYIQEIIKNENKCIVYVTKLAEKRMVNYTDLSPENDAKPWPLPYRFTKNSASTSTPANEKSCKLPKKRKDKRRTKANSESEVLTISEPAAKCDIEAFIGVPLQMQDNSNEEVEAPPPPPPDINLSQHNLLVTPEVNSPQLKFSWDTPWNSNSSNGKYVCSSPYGLKPMVASAPVTPNVIPYHDPQFSFMYNYRVENYESWANAPETVQYDNTEIEKTEYESPSSGYSETQEVQNFRERPPLTLPPPTTQPVEVYSPVIPIPPGTPVIFTHPTEIQDMMVPTPPFLYTPPVDVQYVSPAPYFYSPTIPTTWYPMGVNSQGFIFPN